MENLLGLLVILAATYYWHRNSQKKLIEKNGFKKASVQSKKKHTVKSEYRCVFIKPGRHACTSAKVLKNKAILMDETVSLPLKACDKETCNCQFSRHDDRRMKQRRNEIYVTHQTIIGESNHRKPTDRRNPKGLLN